MSNQFHLKNRFQIFCIANLTFDALFFRKLIILVYQWSFPSYMNISNVKFLSYILKSRSLCKNIYLWASPGFCKTRHVQEMAPTSDQHLHLSSLIVVPIWRLLSSSKRARRQISKFWLQEILLASLVLRSKGHRLKNSCSRWDQKVQIF